MDAAMRHWLIEKISFWGAVCGSMLIASNVGYNQLGYGFFLASSISTAILLLESNASKVILHQTLFFTVVNVVGLVRWM